MDGGKTSHAVVVGRLEQRDFQAAVAAFVFQVDRFKRGSPGAEHYPLPRPSFKPEFDGEKIMSLRAQIEARCRHGVILNALQRLLSSRGCVVGNTQRLDLYLEVGGRVTALFEVKPDADPYSIYTAIGQLYFHGAGSTAAKIVVVPTSCDSRTLRIVRALGIDVLSYSWSGPLPIFEDIPGMFRRLAFRTGNRP